jgi:Polysaccharide lyase family 4, domain II
MKRRNGMRHLVISLAVSLLGVGQVAAYEVSQVLNGGTVAGTVTFTGEVPPAKSFDVHRAPDSTFCGALSDGLGSRLLREVMVGQAGKLQDVVVMVEGVRTGKPFVSEETKLEANICQFVPFVSVVRDHHPITVTNLDPVSHDLQVYERDNEHVFIMFHRPALTKTGTTDMVKFTGVRREITMQCGMHPFMQGHGIAVENPYYALTGLDGTFTIKDLPAGVYRVKAWHPILGTQEQQITVEAGATTSSGFMFHAR